MRLGATTFASTIAIAAANPAAAQVVCGVPLTDTVLCPGNDDAAIVDLRDAPTDVVVTLGDAFRTLTTVQVTSLAGADVVLDPVTTAAIRTVNQPGLALDSGASLLANVTTIDTLGDGATGALLRAVDGVVFTVDDSVTTAGNLADGINIRGSTVSVTAPTVRTSGEDSDGVELVALDGPVNLDADLIETTGGLSSATILESAGDANVNVGVLRTQGAQALGLDLSANAAACVLLGLNGCDNTVTADRITTDGFGSIGALVSAVGDTDLNVGVLQTQGDEAAGLDLSADPTACVVLGVGGCDTSFTVGELTTSGARAPAALIRAAGNVDGDVRVLRTGGDDAIGIDLASDPTACAILGAGACANSLSVGELTTSGAGATGVLARVAGPTSLNIGTLETLGDNAGGIDVAADPTACALIGAGQCDVGVVADSVTTNGDGSAGVLLNAPANLLAQLGVVSTSGNNATALALITDPVVCAAIGPGSCSVQAQADDIDTDGDNSPGVDVDTPGEVDVDVGDVSTGGDNSPGIDVDGGEEPIDVDAENVDTEGDNSPGVEVDGTGPIDVDVGTVTTDGDNSDGVNVVGDDDPVTVDVGQVTTGGDNSDGIDVTTTTGDQTITTGGVTVTGLGSNGIVSTATGCADVAITATGPVSATNGTGILASSGCTVTVTTLPGAPVSGGVAGIDVTSGTGATITLGDSVSSSGGPAIDADGASATILVQPTGAINGYVDLTDSDDVLTNAGSFNATGTSSFGGGADAFVNTGRLAVRPLATTPGTVTFAGLERFDNRGLIDMRNGQTGDRLVLSGDYAGSGNALLGVDVMPGGGGTGDALVIGGAATGTTAVAVETLGGGDGGLLVANLVVVDAGAGTSATAFGLADGSTRDGFVDYDLRFDAAANDFLLFGTPNDAAYEGVKLGEGARQIFYGGNEAVGGHLQSLGDAAGDGGFDDETGLPYSALWGQIFGRYNEIEGASGAASLDYEQDAFGAQIGYDVGAVSDSNAVVGITAGYANSTLRFGGTADRFLYDAANVGIYGRLQAGAFFLNSIARYEHYWIDLNNPFAGFRSDLEGDAYGAMAQAGFRFGSDRFFVEPSVSIDYVHTEFDTLRVLSSTFEFEGQDSVRGKAGVRMGAVVQDRGASQVRVYAGGNVVHQFEDGDRVNFANNGTTLGFVNPGIGTYGEAKIGFSADVGDRVSGFIEAHGEYGDQYRGGGGRAGISVRF